MPADIEKLKHSILRIEFDSGGGYYQFVTVMHDDGEELILWKLMRHASYCCTHYHVSQTAHFSMDEAELFPKEIKVVVSDQRQDSGKAEVVVDRCAGIATITPSSRSSSHVIEEISELVTEYANRSPFHPFKILGNYEFAVGWKRNQYQIELTKSEDWM